MRAEFAHVSRHQCTTRPLQQSDKECFALDSGRCGEIARRSGWWLCCGLLASCLALVRATPRRRTATNHADMAVLQTRTIGTAALTYTCTAHGDRTVPRSHCGTSVSKGQKTPAHGIQMGTEFRMKDPKVRRTTRFRSERNLFGSFSVLGGLQGPGKNRRGI